MRRVFLAHRRRRPRWMMDHESASLVGSPGSFWRSRRIDILPPERGPPFAVESSLPGRRIDGADDKPCHALSVLDDEGEIRIEQRIGRRVDLPHHPWIVVEPRRVAARKPGGERDRKERLEISCFERPNRDSHNCPLANGKSAPWRPKPAGRGPDSR